MRSKAGIICMVLGMLCLTASMALLFHNQAESDEAGEAAQEVLFEIQTIVPTDHQKVNLVPWEDSVSDEMTVKEIDGYGYIGYLSIPCLEIELPVMDTWDYTRLKIAPCRQFGSTKSNDLVIAAHNYERHFGKLSQLNYGDYVSFTDMDGVITLYEVSNIETLQPTQVEKVENSVWDLTLYTCTYGGKSRIVIGCSVVTPEDLATAS